MATWCGPVGGMRRHPPAESATASCCCWISPISASERWRFGVLAHQQSYCTSGPVVPVWVTDSPSSDGQTTSVSNQQPRPTQPPTLSGTGNEYRLKCDDALWLGSKGRYGSFHFWMHVWREWPVKLCDPSLTRATGPT